jgi:integrase
MFKKKGSKNWWIKIRHRGRVIEKSTETPNKELAKKIEAKVRVDLIEEKYFDSRESSELTIVKLLDMYDQKHSATKKKPQVRKNENFLIKRFRELLGKEKAKHLSASRIEKYMTQRRIEGKRSIKTNGEVKRIGDISEVTLHHELALVKHAYYLAINNWGILKHNPFDSVTLPKGDRQRTRFLSVEESIKVVKESPAWLRPMVILGLDTGLRITNICELAWNQVDFFSKTIQIEKTKNQEGVCIPMTERALKTIKGFRRDDSFSDIWVFGKKYKRDQVSKAFKRVCRRLQLDDVTFHTLRHSFCSHLAINGANLNDIASVAGHKDLRSARRYSHLNSDRKREVIKGLEAGRRI